MMDYINLTFNWFLPDFCERINYSSKTLPVLKDGTPTLVPSRISHRSQVIPIPQNLQHHANKFREELL